MADFFAFGNESTLDDSLKATRMVLGRRSEVGKFRGPRTSGGVIGAYVIRFQIQTMTSATRVALCEVTSVPYGMTGPGLPGIDEALSTDLITFVDVGDPTGCYFNEPASQMVGRNGWAMYMQPLTDNVCNPAAYGVLVPQWEVFSVCCGPAVCGDLG